MFNQDEIQSLISEARVFPVSGIFAYDRTQGLARLVVETLAVNVDAFRRKHFIQAFPEKSLKGIFGPKCSTYRSRERKLTETLSYLESRNLITIDKGVPAVCPGVRELIAHFLWEYDSTRYQLIHKIATLVIPWQRQHYHFRGVSPPAATIGTAVREARHALFTGDLDRYRQSRQEYNRFLSQGRLGWETLERELIGPSFTEDRFLAMPLEVANGYFVGQFEDAIDRLKPLTGSNSILRRYSNELRAMVSVGWSMRGTRC